MLRHLRRHLRVPHPLLADALGDPHRGVGVPERVGDPLLAVLAISLERGRLRA